MNSEGARVHFQVVTPASGSRPRRITVALVLCFGLWSYYAFINGSFRRPATAAFATPSFLANEVTRPIGASWRAVAVTSSDTVLRGWLFRPVVSNGKSVLLMHETGGTRLNVRSHVPWLLRRGFTCLTPDGRGHGESGGQLVTAGLLEGADVVRWVRFLRDEESGNAIFGLGHSLGASSLIHGLALGAGLQRVVADSTGANMPTRYQLLAERYRAPVSVTRPLLWLFMEPAVWNARARYGLDLNRISPVDWIRGVRVPVLLVHGQQDHFIPIEEARRVRDANPSWVALWEVAGAGHVTAATLRPDEYQRRVLAWFGAD